MGLLTGLHELGLMSRDPIFVMLFFVVVQYIREALSGFGYKIYYVVLNRHCSELLEYSRYIIMWILYSWFRAS